MTTKTPFLVGDLVRSRDGQDMTIKAVLTPQGDELVDPSQWDHYIGGVLYECCWRNAELGLEWGTFEPEELTLQLRAIGRT